ncbi:uncharacterized protein LOC120682997 [Panicum virgatum]|uniref:Uncharacterized protein n=1 Tax=Panicum virgatum TaxID=38727 RepID=A0A8T0W962_PANVG|nr:uncharacterized protein LOC120682997 [Panicum virgatum]KAG2644230.1 hypothetical protein PVAP13_2KG298216 [Panicum virgatum]
MASSPLAPPRTYSPLLPNLPPPPPCGCRPPRRTAAAARRPVRARVRVTASGAGSPPAATPTKRCLRCGGLYRDEENHPTACAFHGHVTGEKGLFSLSPPHQGIDGEWSDRSGVIVYRWNDEGSRPSTGRANWKRRWSCCQERDEDAPPCQRGRHVSYDDGHTLF